MTATDTSPDFHIVESDDLRKYRSEVPNIIFSLGLSAYELALYLVLKRTAGDGGTSWKSTETLAQEAGMSAGSVSNAKQALTEPREMLGGKALITIEERPRPGGGRARHYITITNIWSDNFRHFDEASSPHEVASSGDEQASSPGELKKEPSVKSKPVVRNGGGIGNYTKAEPDPPRQRATNTAAADFTDFQNTTQDLLSILATVNEHLRAKGGQPYSGELVLCEDMAARGVTAEEMKAAWNHCQKHAERPTGAFLKFMQEGFLPQARAEEGEKVRYNRATGQIERFTMGIGWNPIMGAAANRYRHLLPGAA